MFRLFSTRLVEHTENKQYRILDNKNILDSRGRLQIEATKMENITRLFQIKFIIFLLSIVML